MSKKWFLQIIASLTLLTGCDKPPRLDGAKVSDPPIAVAVLKATAVEIGNAIDLRWVLSADTSDMVGILIIRKTGSAPDDSTDGVLVVDAPIGMLTYRDSDLVDGTEYHYAAFAHDEVSNYAAPARASAIPLDTVVPEQLESLGERGTL